MILNILFFGGQEMQGFKELEEVEAFMLKHGENIVDLLGAEVDRIEKELKVMNDRIGTEFNSN